VSTHNSFPGVFQNCRTAIWVIFRWSGKHESQTKPTLLDAAGRQLSNGGTLDRVGHLGETTRTKTRRKGVCLGARQASNFAVKSPPEALSGVPPWSARQKPPSTRPMPSVKRRCPPWRPQREVSSTLRGTPDGEGDGWACQRSSGVWWGTQTAADAGAAAADGCSANAGPGRHRCRSRGWCCSWCGAPLRRYWGQGSPCRSAPLFSARGGGVSCSLC